jgi:photosystem II stability/assembly factor-like uncharacterized protein
MRTLLAQVLVMVSLLATVGCAAAAPAAPTAPLVVSFTAFDPTNGSKPAAFTDRAWTAVAVGGSGHAYRVQAKGSAVEFDAVPEGHYDFWAQSLDGQPRLVACAQLCHPGDRRHAIQVVAEPLGRSE